MLIIKTRLKRRVFNVTKAFGAIKVRLLNYIIVKVLPIDVL